MPARSSEYNQLGIGDCGHVVTTWPLRDSLAGHGRSQVICDDCTREQYGIRNGEQFIWVRLKAKTIAPLPKVPRKPRKAAPKKPKPKTGMAALLEQEGFFDGS